MSDDIYKLRQEELVRLFHDDKVCPKCLGCGLIANDDEGSSWLEWLAIPPPSNLMVQIGAVKPIRCPECAGTGGKLLT